MRGLEAGNASALRSHADPDFKEDLQFLPVKEYFLAAARAMSRVTVGCDRKPSFFSPRPGIAGAYADASSLEMPGTSFWIYVQISHFVTKVLIRKHFRRLVRE